MNFMDAAKPIDKEISFYLDHLNTQQKKAVLTVVKTFAQEEGEWWEEVEEKAAGSIEKALKQAKAGKLTTHKDVMKKYKKWLPK
jgi:predicted transcriptional regulator